MLDVERVVHAARRVVDWHVERLEVVPIGLDVRTLGNLEPEPDEDVLQTLPRLGHHMRMAALRPRDHFGEIQPLGRQLHRALGGSKLASTLIETLGDRSCRLVDSLTGGALLVDRCQRAKTRLERRERTPLAQQLGFESTHLVGGCGLPDANQRVVTRPLHFFDHLQTLLTTSHDIGHRTPER